MRSGSTDHALYQFTPLGFLIKPGGVNALAQNFSTNDYCLERYDSFNLNSTEVISWTRPSLSLFCSATEKSLEISLCHVNCGYPHIPCIPKCCPEDELISTELETCVAAERKWIPSLNGNTGSETSQFKLHILPKLRHCSYLLGQVTTNQHFILSNDGGHVE